MTRQFKPHNRPTRPNLRIVEACVNGYKFIKAHFNLLLQWSILPIIFNIANFLAIEWMQVTDDGMLRFLYTLPAAFMFGLYVFMQTRLQVFNEHPAKTLKDAPEKRNARRQDLTASLCCYLLLQMAIALSAYIFVEYLRLEDGQDQFTAQQMVLAIAAITGLIWGVKLSALHLITAIGLPIKPYLTTVKGFWFSYTVAGLGFLATFPVIVFFTFILSLVTSSPDLSDANSFGLIIMGSIMSWAVTAVLNASVVELLKQLYTQNIKKGAKK